MRVDHGVPIMAGVLLIVAIAVRLWADRRQRLGVDRVMNEDMTLIDLRGTSR